MNIRTHFHTLTRITTTLVLSAMTISHTTLANSYLDQQVCPPLAQAHEVIERAKQFLDIKEEPRTAKLDDAQAKLYAMCTSGLVATCCLAPALVSGGIETLCSGALGLIESIGTVVVTPPMLFLLVPTAVGFATYCRLQEFTTRGYFKRAVLLGSPTFKALKSDSFFNDSVADSELEGYVMVRFGTAQGALKAVEHYTNLHAQLKQVDVLLEEVAVTDEPELADLNQQLQGVVRSMSAKLIKKISILSNRLKADVKEQLRQQHENAEKARLAAERENNRLRAELAQERDRAAAIQAGNISYTRTVNG